MKKILSLLAIAATLSFMSCGNSKDGDDTTDTPVPVGMMALDLSEYGMNVLINIPDSTHGPLVTEDVGGAVRISVGNNFKIEVRTGEGNMEMKKTVDIAKNEVYKLDKYVVEEPNTIIYQWHMEGSQPETRFFSVVKIGDQNYEVEDVAGEIFSEESCKKMVESAKSLREKPLKKADA